MVFRFYSNAISQASRTLAAGVFIVGMLLVGFAFLIYLLPKWFAYFIAIVFCVAGIGCIAAAVRMFIAARQLEEMNQDETIAYRKNVHVREDERDWDA